MEQDAELAVLSSCSAVGKVGGAVGGLRRHGSERVSITTSHTVLQGERSVVEMEQTEGIGM